MNARRVLFALGAVTAALLTHPALAADAVRGKALYQTDALPNPCAGCHGANPSANGLNILNGRDPQITLTAIKNNLGGMGRYSATILAAEAADIAAYLTNPAAANPAPAAQLGAATLAFGNQVVSTTSATMSTTLTNSGTADLVISSVTLGGTNPGDFTRAGTCVAPLTLAPKQSCTVDATFKPTALGARAATVTLTHNASPSTSAIALSGSGVAAPTPAVALSATSLAFGNQVLGTTSAAKGVSISNTGSAVLSLGAISVAGTNPGDFAATGCSNVTLNPGANCTVNVTFTPAALNARGATLSIASNAAGSPHGVSLSGNGTATPVPGVALAPATLAFGNLATGSTTSKPISVTNSGNAALTISSVTVAGAGFSGTHNCPASLAAAASCTVTVTFAPGSVASYSGSVSVASNAAGSPHSAALTGAGVAPTPTAPVATLAPLAVDFGSQPVNMPSGTKTVMLTNSGTAPLAITALALGGTNAGDFSQTHTCPASLAMGGSCSISVKFTPGAAGARSATLALTSNAAGAPSVDLKGTGVVATSAVATVAPAQLVFPTTRLGRTSDDRSVRVRNTGTTPLTISSVAVTGDFFVDENECMRTLAPGASCEVEVKFKPTALGARSGELTIGGNAAGFPRVVKLTGTAVAGRAGDCDDESACSQSALPFMRTSR